jgi:hypothetical protein
MTMRYANAGMAAFEIDRRRARSVPVERRVSLPGSILPHFHEMAAGLEE